MFVTMMMLAMWFQQVATPQDVQPDQLAPVEQQASPAQPPFQDPSPPPPVITAPEPATEMSPEVRARLYALQDRPETEFDVAADDYVATEQEATAFARWLNTDRYAKQQFHAFETYLQSAGVDGVVPAWQLTRTASAWRRCGAAPLEVPPDYMWPNLVQTLRYARDYVVPNIGQVEAVSVYRNPGLNSCAGGSARSSHRAGFAIDMVPRWTYDRGELMRRLCRAHSSGGREGSVGFGFYVGLRFHIDSYGYRTWGLDPAAGGAPCARALALREAARHSTNGGTD